MSYEIESYGTFKLTYILYVHFRIIWALLRHGTCSFAPVLSADRHAIGMAPSTDKPALSAVCSFITSLSPYFLPSSVT